MAVAAIAAPPLYMKKLSLLHAPPLSVQQPKLFRPNRNVESPRYIFSLGGPKCGRKRSRRVAIIRSNDFKTIERFASSVAAILFRRQAPEPLDLMLLALDVASGGRSGGGWFDRWRRRRPRRLKLGGLAGLLVLAIAATASALEKGSGIRGVTPAVEGFRGMVRNWRSNAPLALGFLLAFLLVIWNTAFRRRGNGRRFKWKG